MHYENLGRSGLKISALTLGTMQFGWTADEPTSHAILTAAWEAGINCIDTAELYSYWVPGNPGGISEQWIGNWLKASGIAREKLVLASKVRGPMANSGADEGLSRRSIIAACEASLRRLQTDYLDLYQTHWFDAHTPIEETLSALTTLVEQGKVRYLGCSNTSAWRLVEAHWAAQLHNYQHYISLQLNYSLVARAEYENDLQEVCQKYGIGVLAYSPLAKGFLSGKYSPTHQPESARLSGVQAYFSEKNWRVLKKADSIATRHGKSISQIALNWCKAQAGVNSVIIGPRTLSQLQDNLGMGEFSLTPNELQDLANPD